MHLCFLNNPNIKINIKKGIYNKGNKCVKKERSTKNIGKDNRKNQGGLKSIIPYFGGKTRVADKIINKFPKHDTFVEPFAGGASIYWKNDKAKKYVINDLNKDIYKLYKTAKNSPQKIKSCDLNDMNRSKFKKVRDKSNKSACDVMKIYKHSFGGNGESYAEKNRNYNNLYTDAHREKLKKTTILNQDFKKLAKRYDKSSKILQYWDPPYVKEGHVYKEHGVTAKEVCDTAKSMKKAKVVLSYDNHPEVRKACKGLKFHKLYVPYSAQGANINKGKIELLITKNI